MYDLRCTMYDVRFRELARCARGFGSSSYNAGKLMSFCPQVSHLGRAYQSCLHQQLKPILAFIRFFFANFKLIQKIGSALGMASRAIIRPDGRGAAQQLLAKYFCRKAASLFQRQTKIHNTQTEMRRSFHHVLFFHVALFYSLLSRSASKFFKSYIVKAMYDVRSTI